MLKGLHGSADNAVMTERGWYDPFEQDNDVLGPQSSGGRRAFFFLAETRRLKKAPSGVLGSQKSSTYPKGTPPVFAYLRP